MKTRVIRIDPEKFDLSELTEAAEALKRGGLVAFPTETVYGLGANALDPAATARIFEAKGRPADNPLIVHVADIDEVFSIAQNISEEAQMLMERFWPGPLTIVLKKLPAVPDAVTCGLDTVAVRMPRSEVALALIRLAGVPVAAPSANLSGSPSPTSASHVIEDFDGRIEYIIDTGDVEVGVESTVLDMTADKPVILRPGGVTREMLVKVLPNLHSDSYPDIEDNKTVTPRSPGTKYAHYSPKAEVIVIDGDSVDSISARIAMMAAGYEAQGIKTGIMATDETERVYISKNVLSMGSRTHPDTIAASIYRLLREFDSLGAGVILVEAVEADGIGAAIMNRLEKAAGGRVVDADEEII